MYRMLKENLRTHPYKMICCHDLALVYKATRLDRSVILLDAYCSNWGFIDEKKLDIVQTVNDQNDRL